MKYKIEELVPIVAELTEQYTGRESTSITYEKAQQLMGAVIYCIREIRYDINQNRIVQTEKIPAMEAYRIGYICVLNKVRRTLEFYNEMMETFDDYQNICLRDTVVKGIPEFFKWYDPKFCPQDTILTLDYPVEMDLSKYQGIDAISYYLACVAKEQTFLHQYRREDIMNRLETYCPDYSEIIENLTSIVRMEEQKGI